MQTGRIGERVSKLEQFLGKWSLEQMLVGEIDQFLYIKLSVNFQLFPFSASAWLAGEYSVNGVGVLELLSLA